METFHRWRAPHALTVAEAEAQPARALIAYEDPICAQAAEAFSDQCDLAFGPIETTVWNFESLKSQAVRQLAIAQAAMPQLLIIAAREGLYLPSPVKFLVGTFIAAKAERPRAMVALLNVDGWKRSEEGPVQRYLRTLAELDRMSFVCSRFTAGPREDRVVPPRNDGAPLSRRGDASANLGA